MTEPKPKRRNKRRPRRIPNAAPGLEDHSVPSEPAAAHPMQATVGGDSLPREPMYVPKGILAIDHLGQTEHLADDFSVFTPEQRKFWRGAKNKHRRIKDEHKRAFIDELNRLPSVAGAAKKSGFTVRSWYCLRARDPAFAAEWDAAIDAGIPVLEHAAMVRAFHGVERPIFQNGQRVGSELVMSDRLAEVLLRAHKPERYSEKLMVAGQINGRVDHVHHLAPATADLVRSIAGVGAPVIDGTAEQVPQVTAAGIVSAMLAQDVVDNGTAPSPEDERTSKKRDTSSG